jgi:glycosyltransferase involved in cell wall biosynthesis
VVCSNNTSLPEITNGAAILAHPDDSHSLAEAVMSISGDRALRERMATCGRQQAAKFSWERTAEGVTAVYHQVAYHTAEQR